MSDYDAKNDLVKFITNYTSLLSKQLAEVHTEMEGAVETIMDGINRISTETDEQTKNADTVLVGDASVVKVDGKQLAADEKSKIKELGKQGVNVSPDVVQAGNRLKEYMAGLHDLDDTLQQAIFSIMGRMSNDDIIRQKIEHIAYTCTELAKTLNEVYMDVDSKLLPDAVEGLEQELLKKVMDSYTMESEKDQFKKVFNG
ncbi:hypothetical protein N9W79_01145 [bacterium]|nr:hypothetical protein [bacterium]